jgi:LacI family transcriptional regulator
VSYGDFSERGGAHAAERLLMHRPRPTGLTTGSVAQAAGAIHVASRLGLRVPRDLSIVSCVDAPLAEFLGPPVTAVRISYAKVGAAAVDALVAQLSGGEPRDVLVHVELEMICRGSSAPPVDQ